MPTAHNTMKSVDKPPKLLLQPDPWTHRYPLPRKGNRLRQTSQTSKRTSCFFSLPPAAAGAPEKPCLNFLSGFCSMSTGYERPRTLVGNITNFNVVCNNKVRYLECLCALCIFYNMTTYIISLCLLKINLKNYFRDDDPKVCDVQTRWIMQIK